MSEAEEARRKAVEKWANTASPNPRYRGATPAMVGRALLGYRPVTPSEKVIDADSSVKTSV